MIIKHLSIPFRCIVKSIPKGNENSYIRSMKLFGLTLPGYFSNLLTYWNTLYKNYLTANNYDDLLHRCQPALDKTAQMAVIRNMIIPDSPEILSSRKYHMTTNRSIPDDDLMKGTIHEAVIRMVYPNFVLYTIEESIKLFNRTNYNPFELRDIILKNAEYI